MRIILLTIAILTTLNTYSQESNTDFKELINAHAIVQNQLWKDEDYELVLELMLNFEEKYEDNHKLKYDWAYINLLYNISCAYSLLDQPDNAVKYLNLAIDNGYKNYYGVQKDTDFENIRNSAGFEEVIRKLREKGDYEYILKKYSKYSDSAIYIPTTNFQDANELSEFRLKYNLDSIAGAGDEFSKIVNLMKWVHSTVRHDGSSRNPANKSADQLITICNLENRGVNCRMLAMILNDAYLSMGFKSRYITCLPKGEKFRDCHVINMVYSNDYKKWLWMDPSFEVYVMDGNDTPLSIHEVREKLINDQFVKLSDGLNWNGKPYSGGEERYLHQYMAKNLFRFSIPVESVSGYESEGNDRTYIDLFPNGYNPSNFDFGVKIGNRYYTTNSKDFWENGL